MKLGFCPLIRIRETAPTLRSIGDNRDERISQTQALRMNTVNESSDAARNDDKL